MIKQNRPSLVVLLVVILTTVCSAKAVGNTNSTPPINDVDKLRFSNIKLKTGVRLHYAEQGKPNGPVVLMLHGFSDSWFSFSRVVSSMERKYHIYILDQRGHGNSDRPQTGYTPRHLAEDALAFMEAKGIERATVVGHSMGSFVAQQLATLAPSRVTKLVLIGSADSVKNDVVRGLREEIKALTDPVSERFIRDFQMGTLARPVPQEFLAAVFSESGKLPARVWKEIVDGLLTGADAELTKIKAPTLIIWGDRETVFLRVEQDKLITEIAKSQFRVYEGTGHSPPWEEPERVARDLQEFIAGS